jgi:cytochrome c peroxidase
MSFPPPLAGQGQGGGSPAGNTMRQAFASILSATAAALLWTLAEPVTAGTSQGAPDATLGLPSPGIADDKAADRIALGRKLFMDRRLSPNATMSCGMCHVPEQGFAVNELTTAVGIEGRSLRRNAPTVLNVGFNTSLFHDGRTATLEEQAWGPLLAVDEMGNPSREAVAARIRQLLDYAGWFERVFPEVGLSPDTIGAALAAYQRSLVSGGSRFDRWFFRREAHALSASELRGYVLFRGRAQCSACHDITAQHALFTDNEFHNIGVGVPTGDRSTSQVSVQLAPGVETKVSVGMLDSLFGAPALDEGRFEVTKLEKDRFSYRTPTLRNVELTAPYMHDGSLATLRDVVDFYDRGGNSNPGLDKFMTPLFLTEREKEDLVAFMRSLTGANVQQLAAQARAAASAPSFR